MKERIIVRTDIRKTGVSKISRETSNSACDWKLNFYLVAGGKTIYLFTQDYTKGVYDFFKNGRSANELRQFKQWKRNPRLDKTIEKIPIYRTYVMREIA